MSDLERLVFVSIELSMYEFSYLQVADTNLYDKIINLREEKQKLKSKIEKDLEKAEKWDKYSEQFIVTVKNDETFMEPIINKELEVKIESLKQELQVKVLEIVLLKEEKHNDVDCAIHLFGASLTREQCWEIVKNHNELFELKQKLKEIDEYAEQLRYSQSIISWQLKEILKEKN